MRKKWALAPSMAWPRSKSCKLMPPSHFFAAKKGKKFRIVLTTISCQTHISAKKFNVGIPVKEEIENATKEEKNLVH